MASPTYRFSVIPALSVALLLVAGCASSSGPSVSGFALGDTRVVTHGDEVVIRFPASSQTGAAKWRLTEFDSRMLSLTQRPRLEAAGENRFQWTSRFTARTPGETEVVFTRTAASPDSPGEVGERRRFRIRINER